MSETSQRARVNVEPNRRGQSGSRESGRHHQHRHGQCKTKYCGRQAPCGCYARACLSQQEWWVTSCQMDECPTERQGARLPRRQTSHNRNETQTPGISSTDTEATQNSRVSRTRPYRASQETLRISPPADHHTPPTTRQSSHAAGEPLLERPGHTARPCRTDQQPAATPNERPTNPHQTQTTIAPTCHVHAALYIRAQLPIRCRTSAPARTATPRQHSPHAS
jgi:hypothetical protein